MLRPLLSKFPCVEYSAPEFIAGTRYPRLHRRDIRAAKAIPKEKKIREGIKKKKTKTIKYGVVGEKSNSSSFYVLLHLIPGREVNLSDFNLS